MSTINFLYVMVDLPDGATVAQSETIVAQAIAKYLVETVKKPGNVTATLVKTLSNASVASLSEFSGKPVDVSSFGTTTSIVAEETVVPTSPFVSSSV